jgi:hypothetical protein
MKLRFWSGDSIKTLQPNHVFVFGSNPQGIHGAGGAKVATGFGAKYGIGRGLQGQTYALVTKNLNAGFKEPSTGIVYDKAGYKSVSSEQISENIKELYVVAKNHPDLLFIISYKYETWENGQPKKSLNGYDGKEIFDLFTKNKDVPSNMVFHNSFKVLLPKKLATTFKI